MSMSSQPPTAVSTSSHTLDDVLRAVEKASSKRVLSALDLVEFAAGHGATPEAVAALIARDRMPGKFEYALRFAADVAERLAFERSKPQGTPARSAHLRLVK